MRVFRQLRIAVLWPPLAYFALTIAMTWPLAVNLGDHLHGGLDPLLQTWTLAWDAHALRTDPLAAWHAPIFYPYPNTLAYTDNHLGLAVVAAPLIWLSGNPVLVHNLLLLLSFALSSWAVYGLALELLHQNSRRAVPKAANHYAAFVAGAAFAFGAFRTSHLPHLNLLQTMWLPWALLFLIRLLRASGGRWRDALLFGLFAGLQCITALYFAFFALLVLGLYTLLWAVGVFWRRLRSGERLPWGTAAKLVAGAGLAGMLALPTTLPYLQVYGSLGIVRSIRELDNWSAPLQAYLAVAPGNRLYGIIGGPFEASGGELALFPGILVSIFAFVGLIGQRTKNKEQREQANQGTREQENPAQQSDQRVITLLGHQVTLSPGQEQSPGHPVKNGRLVTWFLPLLLLIAFVLSLGTGVRLVRGGEPLPIPLPYTLLYSVVPGFGALRVPSRWGMLVLLALVLLAARGLAITSSSLGTHTRNDFKKVRHWHPAALFSSITLLVVLAEAYVAPVALGPAPALASAPPVYGWLGAPEQSDIRVVLELPAGKTPRGAELDRIMHRQYLGMLHWKALPVAYSGLIPFGTTDLLGRVQSLPEEETLQYLQLVGVDTLVVHREQYDPAALASLLSGLDGSPLVRRRAELGNALVYSLLPGIERDQAVQPGASVYVSADERVPGLPALALVRHWQMQRVAVYGQGRVRYYAPLLALRPGQVFEYGLLAANEQPEAYGFEPGGLQWASNGLAFYAKNPALRASLPLGKPPVGQFHPAYPSELPLTIEANRLRAGDMEVNWNEPLETAYLELDVASLLTQSLFIGEAQYTVEPGITRLSVPLALNRPLQIVGAAAQTALLRIQVGAGEPPAAIQHKTLAITAEPSFDGSRLIVAVQAAGHGELQVVARGAAALDDKPILLFEGNQPLPPGGSAWVFDVDLLKPEAAWLQQAGEAQDGRYQVYLKQAGSSDTGLPVATFSIRNGAIVDLRPVPIPLTALR